MFFPVEVKSGAGDYELVIRLLMINPGRELKRYDPRHYDHTPGLLHALSISREVPFEVAMETRGILLQLFSRFIPGMLLKRQIKDIRIYKTIEYIHRKINLPLSVDELARFHCLTEDHFIRLFRREMDQTPGNYILRKKIEKAQLL